MTISRPITRRPSIRPTGVMKTQEDVGLSPKTMQHDMPQLGSRVTALDLVARYPDLSEAEIARLIGLYRQLPTVDIALMLSDQTLGPKLQHFTKDQKRAIKTPLRDYAFLVVFAVIGIAIIASVMLSGKM